MTRDPNTLEPLLSSAEDPELRALLEAGRDELPSEAQLAGLASKLGPILGPGGGGQGGAGAVAARGAAGAAIAKVIGAATLAVVLGSAAVHAVRSRAQNDSLLTTRATSAPVAGPPADSALSPSAALPTPSPPPSASVTPASAPRSAPVAARPPPSVIPLPPDPSAEVAVLQVAQAALPTDPSRTLTLCEGLARRYPTGVMAQEREVLAIEALAKLGRKDEARTRADTFAATYPSSTHLRRLHAVLAGAN